MTRLPLNGSSRAGASPCSLVSVLSVTVFLALLTGCSRVQQLSPRTGDEPPIRVRNGSLEIELAWQTKEFEEDPNSTAAGKMWQIKDAGREKNRFLVVIVSSNTTCNGLVSTANKVDVDYSDGQKIDIQPIGGPSNSRTKITAHGDVLNKISGQLLRYGTPGELDQYISEIRIIGGGQPQTCTFASRDPNLQIFLLD